MHPTPPTSRLWPRECSTVSHRLRAGWRLLRLRPGRVRDWQVVRSHLVAESDPDDLVFAATQFLHVTEAGSRAEALEDQIPGFLEVMGDHRTVEDLQAS